MDKSSNRRIETLIYAGLWLLAIVFLLLDIMRGRSYTSMPLLDANALIRVVLNLLPLMVLFVINNYLLIPKLLKEGEYKSYFLSAIILVGGVWIWQRCQFYGLTAYFNIPEHPKPPVNVPQPLMPLPLFLDVIYDLLILGVNLAISLLFQHFDDRLEQEQLKKQNAENQLTYLKAQINPHFYMNMLNNIHGLIEINPAKAQDTVIEMSGLMRYMLYESSRPKIELSSEIRFIRNYMDLMRQRYPEDAVRVTADFPDGKDIAGIYVAPLLFLVFIENAFKHGVSYAEKSFISVKMKVIDGFIHFSCINSRHVSDRKGGGEGIGLENAKTRMDLIYADHYNLLIEPTDKEFDVKLTLPYEIEYSHN